MDHSMAVAGLIVDEVLMPEFAQPVDLMQRGSQQLLFAQGALGWLSHAARPPSFGSKGAGAVRGLGFTRENWQPVAWAARRSSKMRSVGHDGSA
nr:hypothetical protein [Pseudomonas oleovorans]